MGSTSLALGGTLSLRVSADAVRSMTRRRRGTQWSLGGRTGGVIAFYTGWAQQVRFNATNFIPSFRDRNGLRFDHSVPRFTFSGPLEAPIGGGGYDGPPVELEADNIYISELPGERE